MATQPTDWLTCREAVQLVRKVGFDDQDGFPALLRLCEQGLVRVKSEHSEIRARRLDWPLPSDHSLAPNGLIEREEDRAFFRQIQMRYVNPTPFEDFFCFLTGNFKVSSGSFNFTVNGLAFCREDIIKHFGLHPLTEQTAASAITAEKRRGRTKGSGSFEKMDWTLIQEMNALIEGGMAASPEAAADAVADRAYGNGIRDSKKTRLAKRYRAWRRESEPN